MERERREKGEGRVGLTAGTRFVCEFDPICELSFEIYTM